MPNYPDSDRAIDDALTRRAAGTPPGSVHQRLALERDWLDPPDRVEHDVRYELAEDALGPTVTARLGEHRIALERPVALEPVRIPKPWGQEIWHTGIEARGESRVRTNAGTLPLSQYLALAPDRLCGRAPLVLLKILDPRPEEVLGDLYFEVHAQKQEVYVVTHVDPDAWPDGTGGIRFGMSQAQRAHYRDDAAFRLAYLQAVRDYERVRRALDAGRAVPREREAELRARMETFTELRALRIGDVVVVPTWLPHALQHGVRVIEFQTPTYERYVISFAQKVLTQPHWDSAHAVARMRLDRPAEPSFVTLAPGVEQIVAFDDFTVWRVTLSPGAAFELPDHPSYALCMGVSGALQLDTLALGPEQALFVPRSLLAQPGRRAAAGRIHNTGSAAATFLVAAPDL